MAVLIANAAATWAMTGLIWFVQVVHYPLLPPLDAAGNAEHQRRTGWVVALPMAVEAITAVALVADRPDGVPLGLAVAGLALVAVLWVTTALVQVPRHRDLALGAGDAARLVRGNWIRTAAWTTRAGIAVAMLALAV